MDKKCKLQTLGELKVEGRFLRY